MPRPEEAAFTKDRLDEMSPALHYELMRIYATKDRKKAKVFTNINNSLAHPVVTIYAWAG
jgi:hypothetical protein